MTFEKQTTASNVLKKLQKPNKKFKMKSTDLRIGNFVIYGGSETQMDAGEFIHFVRFPEKYEPIPLTEEWLLKMGFRATVENSGNLPCFKKDKITIARWTDNKWQVWYKSLDLVMSAQEVHQLQNLYHALTGEELKIKDHA